MRGKRWCDLLVGCYDLYVDIARRNEYRCGGELLHFTRVAVIVRRVG